MLGKLGRLRRAIRENGFWTVVRFLVLRVLRAPIRAVARARTARIIEGLNASPLPRYVVVSTIDWKFRYRQRPQHLADALARSGVNVVYLNPEKSFSSPHFPEHPAEHLHVLPFSWETIIALQPSNVVLLSTDNGITGEAIRQLKNAGHTVVYDYIDEISEVISREEIGAERMQVHRELLGGEADVVVVSADFLEDDVRTAGGVSVKVTNGVEYERFAPLNGRTAPRTLPFGKTGGVIGYYGALAEWLDYELVLSACRQCPEFEFVMIGPDYDGSMARIEQRPANLKVLPPVSYDKLPAIAQRFDVCMIPFKVNDITEATSPLKLFEYLAMGKPVVSTPIREAKKYSSVIVADGEQFAGAVREAYETRDREDLVAERQETAYDNSWENLVRIFRRAVENT